MRSGGGWRIALALAALAAPASAESRLQLAAPAVYGEIPASTYDDDGRQIGAADVRIEKLPSGQVRIFSECGIEGGARTVARALLQPIEGGRSLRLLRQESRSFLPDGEALGVLSIDHIAGVASCTHQNGAGIEVRELPLPETDRVANLSMSLLFLPLVQGDAESVNFQIFLCRGERPRFVDFEAHVVRRADPSADGRRLVEVRYSPDLGHMLSFVARGFVPRLSFWFDPDAAEPWIGHRLPLYGSGPEVTVIRDGVPPALLNGH